MTISRICLLRVYEYYSGFPSRLFIIYCKVLKSRNDHTIIELTRSGIEIGSPKWLFCCPLHSLVGLKPSIGGFEWIFMNLLKSSAFSLQTWKTTSNFFIITLRDRLRVSNERSLEGATCIICDPASQNQQKVAWPSFVLWLEIGDQGQHG